jgi:hypothetical protein
MTARSRSNRIEVDIAANLQQVSIPVNQDRLESALQHVPNQGVPAIESLRVHAIDVPHQARQVGSSCLHDDMVVISCTVSLIQAVFVRIATRAIGQSRSMIARAMSQRSVAMESGT